MTQSHIQTVLRLYEAFGQRDLDTIRAAFAPDAVTEQAANLPWQGRHIGPDGFVAFIGNLLSHLDTVVETEQIFDAGDAIVQVGHTRGRGLAEGNEFKVREIHVWRFGEDGLVTSFQILIDAPAMRAALAGETVGLADASGGTP